MRFLMFLGSLVVAALPLRAGDTYVYDLRMSRSTKVGDRFLRTGSAREESSRVVQLDRKLVDAEERKIDLRYEVEVEVLKVKGGRPASVRAKILKIDGTMNGKAVTQLSAGDQLTVTNKRNSEDDEVTVNGVPADDDQRSLVANMVNVSNDRTPNDDAIFGTLAPVQVGAVWKVDSKNALALLGSVGKSLKPEDVNGSTRLLDVVEMEGKSCLSVRSEFAVAGTGLALPNAPPDLRIARFEANVLATGDFPVDTKDQSLPSLAMGLSMVIEMEGLQKEADTTKELSVTTIVKAARKESVKVLP